MGAPTPRKKPKSVKNDPKYKVGYEEGMLEGKKRALSYLEAKYMHPSTARGTPEAEAILTLTRELATYLREN